MEQKNLTAETDRRIRSGRSNKLVLIVRNSSDETSARILETKLEDFVRTLVFDGLRGIHREELVVAESVDPFIVVPTIGDVKRAGLRQPELDVALGEVYRSVGNHLMFPLQLDSCDRVSQVGFDSQNVVPICGDPGPALQSNQVERTRHADCRECPIGVRTFLEVHLPRWSPLQLG